MRHHFLIITLGLLAACSPKNLGGLPETTGDETTLVSDSMTAGESTLTADETTHASSTGVSATEASATEVSATEITIGDTEVETTGSNGLHRDCQEPVPDPLPLLPEINLDAEDTPLFDGWSKIACEDVGPGQLCGGAGDPQCNGMCLHGVDGDGPGVCAGPDIDIWCDGEGEAINFDSFNCWVCAEVQLRAVACCNDLPGFDCRTWPYPADGPAGSVCARHEDCEEGLICGPHKGSGYGLCQCPGLPAEQITPPQSCFGQ